MNVTTQQRSDDYKVTFVRSYSQANTVNSIDHVEYTSGDLVLPEAKAIANYSFTGYTVNGESKSAGDTVAITADTQILMNYELNSDATFTVTINGEATSDVAYNAKLTATSNVTGGDTAWVEKPEGANSWRLFGYGDTITFYVSESTEIKSIAKTDLGTGEYSGIDATKGYANVRVAGPFQASDTKTTFNGQYVIPEDAKLEECGLLIGKGFTDTTMLKLENVGSSEYKIIRGKSTQQTPANQFAVSINNLSGSGLYCTYVIYVKDNVTYTVYSDVKEWSK
jgi:hypothetical protein